MKRIISMLTAAVCILSAVSASPVFAMEAGTMTEHQEQWKAEQENAFPDPDAVSVKAAVGDLEFSVYDEYAVLTNCTDREVTAVTIPAYVNEKPVLGVVDYPFGFCRKLTEITVPETMQYIEWNNLVSTTIVNVNNRPSEPPVASVRAVHIPEENPYYTVLDGIVYSKDLKTLIGCPPAAEITELSIPAETETIGDYAFAEQQSLEKAVIPDQIRHICNGAFAACPKLTYAEYPADMTMIAGDMFFGCEALTAFSARGELHTIGYGAFSKCTSLTEFTIPETVTAIGSSAFEEAGCIEKIGGVWYVQNWAVGSDEDVPEVILREGTVGAAEMAFFNRSAVTLLDFPQSVKYVGDLCFFALSRSVPSVLHYRGSVIGARTFAPAKTVTDFYIYDPECEIADNEQTIPAAYKYAADADAPDLPLPELADSVTGKITIHGYAGSTAEAYAKKYDRPFEEIPSGTLAGDVNADRSVSIADAVLLAKWLTCVPDTVLPDPQAADLDQDTRLTAADLTLLKRILLTV